MRKPVPGGNGGWRRHPQSLWYGRLGWLGLEWLGKLGFGKLGRIWQLRRRRLKLPAHLPFLNWDLHFL
jgi:hypothetical protein